jgi:hypothetical protein
MARKHRRLWTSAQTSFCTLDTAASAPTSPTDYLDKIGCGEPDGEGPVGLLRAHIEVSKRGVRKITLDVLYKARQRGRAARSN